MSERDSTPGGSRRPTYGLPGPTPSGDAPSAPSTSGYAGPPSSASRYGAPQTAGSGYEPSFAPAGGPPPATRTRRRGIVPLVIGLALLVVLAPIAFIGGLVWSLGSLASDAVSGPQPLTGGSGEVTIAANEMIIVYVPTEDSGATCTVEGPEAGSVTIVPSSGTVTFGDGSTYEQTIGVAAVADATVTVSCIGTDAPAYLGPYSLFGIAGPLLIGPIIGVLLGLVGLVLVIVGIVKLVRSGRS